MNSPIQAKDRISIHPDTHIGTLSLNVSDLDRSIGFYTQVLGFKVLGQESGSATVGAGSTPLLFLREKAGAQPRSPFTTGLYHFAILVPTRADLGRSLLNLAATQYPLDGSADHLVSEALYLTDPDGNGIEIYRDRPREEWPSVNGHIRMSSDPLDIRGILRDGQADTRSWEGLPEGTQIGHMHLQVADIPQAEGFYSDLLGLDVMVKMPGALFVSAGGYHHHLGLNTWQSRGAGPDAPNAAGLRNFTLALPNREEQQRIAARLKAEGIPYEQEGSALAVLDPWGNRVLLDVPAQG